MSYTLEFLHYSLRSATSIDYNPTKVVLKFNRNFRECIILHYIRSWVNKIIYYKIEKLIYKIESGTQLRTFSFHNGSRVNLRINIWNWNIQTYKTDIDIIECIHDNDPSSVRYFKFRHYRQIFQVILAHFFCCFCNISSFCGLWVFSINESDFLFLTFFWDKEWNCCLSFLFWYSCHVEYWYKTCRVLWFVWTCVYLML